MDSHPRGVAIPLESGNPFPFLIGDDTMSILYNETDIDNELVSQKDRLIRMIDSEETQGKDLSEALNFLLFVAPLWKTCSYEYKTRELLLRIDNEGQRMLQDAHDDPLLILTEETIQHILAIIDKAYVELSISYGTHPNDIANRYLAIS